MGVVEGLLLLLLAGEPPKPAPGGTESGEARRNENLFITALDNNVQREAAIRFGNTATVNTEYQTARRYYGGELGVASSGPIHLEAGPAARALHGSVMWRHAGSALAARTFFQVGDVKPARENVAGVRILAPLWRGLFLTAGGEGERRSGFVNGNVLVPRADERTCLSPDRQACALIDRWFRAWPAEAPNRTDVNERALNTNAAQAAGNTSGSVQVDQSLGRTRWSARHTASSYVLDAFQLVAGQNPDTTMRTHDARLTVSRAVGARGALDASAAFQRATALLVPEPNAVGPQVVVGTALEKLGPGSTIPVDRAQNRFRVAAGFNRKGGKHDFSAGGEVARLQFNGREASSNRGNYYFRNDYGLDAITSFRLGLPNRYSGAIGELSRGFRRGEQHYYVQDVWRLRPRLSLSCGLRYQPAQSEREVDGLTRIPFQCDCNNLAPSAGVAWQGPGRAGVWRAAYSVQYGEVFPATLQQVRWNPPLFQKVEVQNPDLLRPMGAARLDPQGRAIVFSVPEDLKTPYSHQYNLLWQPRAPSRAGKVELGYVGSRTWKLLYMWYQNRAVPVAGVPQTTDTINLRRPDPRYYDYRRISNGARAYFDAFRVNYSLPAAAGFDASVSYWWSKAIDTGATYINIAAGDDANQGHSQTERGAAADLRGLSAFDQAHSLLMRLTYQVPGKLRGAAGRLAGNWRVSAVLAARSGTPFTVLSGSDAPGYGNVDGVTGDRPHLLDPGILGRTVGHPDQARQLLPRSAFACIRPDEPRGNLGTNTFRRGPIRNWNAALERSWSLDPTWSLRFRADAINAWNTPQFAEPNPDLSSPAFGMITNTLNDGRIFRFSVGLSF